jgi:hypothetical protein
VKSLARATTSCRVRQAICSSDDSTGTVMGIFAPGYTRHQYAEGLLTRWRTSSVTTSPSAPPDC